MHTREDFIRAICKSPEDDMPRLTFADWLDERDGATDFDKATAEFIRVSCSLSNRKQMPKRAYEWLLENWQRLVPSILRHHTPHYGEPNAKYLLAVQMGREITVRIRIEFTRGHKTDTILAPITLRFHRGFLVRFATKSTRVRGLIRHSLRAAKPLGFLPRPIGPPSP